MIDEDESWVWNLSADEMFEAIREGKVDKIAFAIWVENKYDAGYEAAKDEYGDGPSS